MPPPTHQTQNGQDPVLIGMCHLVSSWQGSHRPMGSSGGETETCRGKRHPKPKPAIPDACDCGSSIVFLGVCDCPTARRQARPPAPCLPAIFGRLATPTAVFFSDIPKVEKVADFKKDMAAFCMLEAYSELSSPWMGVSTNPSCFRIRIRPYPSRASIAIPRIRSFAALHYAADGLFRGKVPASSKQCRPFFCLHRSTYITTLVYM